MTFQQWSKALSNNEYPLYVPEYSNANIKVFCLKKDFKPTELSENIHLYHTTTIGYYFFKDNNYIAYTTEPYIHAVSKAIRKEDKCLE